MIELYTAATPNGHKISIALEELGLPFNVHHLSLSKNEQKQPDYLRLNPNGRIPTIIDRDNNDFVVFESGAILIYLAEKTASPLLPKDGPARAATLEWLFFQMASLGPMFGQLGHFVLYAPEQVPYAITRYTDEAKRILGVVEKRLGEVEYLAGEYSIADIAAYPWVSVAQTAFGERNPELVKDLPNINAWVARLAARPAVERGMSVPAA